MNETTTVTSTIEQETPEHLLTLGTNWQRS